MFNSHAALYEEFEPKIRECGWTPKSYSNLPAGYMKPKEVAMYMYGACPEMVRTATSQGVANSEIAVHTTNFHGMAKYKMPLFWVGKDLMDAVLNTNFSNEMTAQQLKWPFKTICFMVPEGSIHDQEEYNVSSIIMTYKEPGEICSLPGHNKYDCINQHDHPLVMMTALPQFGSPYTYWGSTDASKPLCELERFNESHNKIDGAFVERVMAIGLQLLAIMNACPEYVEQQQIIKRAKKKIGKKKVKVNLHSIQWVGKGYTRVTVTESGDHKIIKTFWRRGHTRQQPYGKNFSKRKIVWIKPVLVNP